MIGWIDFSSEHRNRTMKILDLLKEPGTLDELGVGVIRDAFSEFFFPGTSTIQTRSKYLLLIPWIMQDLELQCVPSRDFIKKLHEQEIRFIEILINGSGPGAVEGIIGQDSRDKLRRKPSEVYWRGLVSYGISPYGDLSMSQVARLMDDLYVSRKQQKLQRYQSNKEDPQDDADIDRIDRKVWHVLPPPPDWRDKLDIFLTREEAAFLHEKMIRSHPDSLMGIILREHLEEVLDCPSLGDIPFMGSLPLDLQQMIQTALDVSLVLEGAHIRFNILVQRMRGTAANKSFETEFEQWFTRIGGFDWSRWDPNELQHRLNLSGSVRDFLLTWATCIRHADWNRADELIRRREWSMKHSRSKLANPAKLVNQEEWIGIRTFRYRWPDARRHFIDIAEGLKGVHEHA